ncbi:MAG: nucleotide exchange factor GrpE [Prevotella sp.]|jgi:molecular chaperone GrpE|nr:nucleotide exchange factor GrpE [Prevotella sp.]
MSEEKKINIEDGNLDEQKNKADEQQAAENTQEEATQEEEKQEQNDSQSDEKQEEKDPLDAALTEIQNLKEQMLYKQAEFENYRKRTIKEKAELILNGGEKTITAILPVLDDFERALADKTDDPKAIKEGMELIFHKFVKTLEGLGVKKIDTADKDFDVDFHEAIAMVPGMGDDKKGKVIDCVQTGYMLNDKVIRHAKVAVGQ